MEPEGPTVVETESVEKPEIAQEPEWLGELIADQIPQVTVKEMPGWLDRLHPPDQEEGLTEEPLPPATDAVPATEEAAQLVDAGPEEPLSQPPREEAPVIEQGSALDGEPTDEEPVLRTIRRELVTEGGPVETIVPPHGQETNLQLARAYLRQGNLNDSVLAYESLVQMPSMTDALVADLEQAIETYPDHPVLRRLLGDAYMRAGQLQKALVAYQDSLTRL
jgi:hypothetical protein